MRGSLRLLLALAFAALFVLLPGPDAKTGVPYLAFLRLREWLLDPGASPLRDHVRDGRLPPLDVVLLQSPPIEDPAERAARAGEYARIAAEWAAARTGDGEPTRVDPGLPPVPVEVRIGDHGAQLRMPAPDGSERRHVVPFASRLALLPAVLAIVLAVLTQRVLTALLVGGLAGAIAHVATAVPGASVGFVDAVVGGTWHFVGDAIGRRSLGEDFYLRITAFVVFLFMTIGVMTRNGGIHGLVDWLRRRIRGPVGAQAASFVAGLAVFFDDYTNCLVVGTTMRPLCDHHRVSREKLAWIVDSTAAPVAGLSVFSTWITYEMSMYRAPLQLVTRADGTPYRSGDAFGVFLETMPFRFYCVFALLFVALVVLLRRDFGPMLAAERRARHLGQLLDPQAVPMMALHQQDAAPAAGVPQRLRNAAVPLAVLVLGTIGLMLWMGATTTAPWPEGAGFAADLRFVLAHAESDVALLWSSIAAWLAAVLLSLGQRLLPLRAVLATSLRSLRALGTAFGILFLAWALGHVCTDLGTSHWLCASARGAMRAEALPIVLFAVSATMAFATGTSFGTMAILLPNVVLMAHRLGTDAAFTGSAAAGGPALMLLCLGAVLEGAIFGDHCSPISDTTVLSSLGAQCDLIGHVRTQLPYALLVAVVAGLVGYLPMVWLGPAWWPLAFAVGPALLVAVLLVCGRDPGRVPAG